MEADNIEDKIHRTASKLAENWLESSLTICHYVKVQQRDVICETRRYKANKTAKYIEIKYIIFIENNDYPYENYNNYIELSIVFHPMIIFFRK
jgi:hypothetical protein